GGVACGEVEVLLVGGLILHPAVDRAGEGELAGCAAVDGHAERDGERRRQRRPVEARRRLGLPGLERLALDEQALAGEDRGETMMALGQIQQLAPDAEEPGDEIFQGRRQLDEEGRFLLARGRLGARGGEALAQLGGESAEERRVDPRQAFAGVEIGEGEAMSESQIHQALSELWGAARLRYCQAIVAAANAVISAMS